MPKPKPEPGPTARQIAELAVAEFEPPKTKKPVRDAAILHGKALGKQNALIMAQAECSERTVRRIAADHADYVAECKREVDRKVLAGLGRAVTARLEDASNADSRTGAQSYRTLVETLGWIGRPHTEITFGDRVTVEVDARSLTIEALGAEELAREIAAGRGALGAAASLRNAQET